MAKFEIILQNNKSRQYHSMAVLLVVLSIAVFIVTSFYSSEKYSRIVALAGAGLSGMLLLADVLKRKKKNTWQSANIYPMFAVAFTWAIIVSPWVFALGFVLMMLYAISQRRLLVAVDTAAVLYPAFPPRTVQWSELSNVVLKDGLLTIDFKNDKLLQSELAEYSPAVNEQEFNEFCRERLTQERV